MEIHYKDLTIGEKYGIISKNSQLTYDIIGICMSYNKIFSTFEIINRYKKYSAKYKTIFYMNSGPNYTVKFARATMSDEDIVRNAALTARRVLPHILKWGIGFKE